MAILTTFAVILSLFILESGGLIQAKYFRDVGGVGLTKMSSLANRRLTSLAVSEPSSIEVATSIDDTDSVHLQLNKKSNAADEGTSQSTELEEVEGFISITEYIRLSDNSTILATAGAECGNMPSILEAFSMHIFGSNYSEMEGMQLNKRRLNLNNTEEVKPYIDLWKIGHLVSENRHFPVFEKKEERFTPGREVFVRQVNNLANNFKKILADKEKHGNAFSDFLIAEDILKFQNNVSLNRTETLSILKAFAVWFKVEFPYFYHKCSLCGQNEGNTFYGHVVANATEQSFKAVRTELYYCSNSDCSRTFRFPRYNDASKLLETRQGRCGEYSMLMWRLLLELNYDAKWVIDWADHAWCEVLVPDDDEKIPSLPLMNSRKKNKTNSWIHVDPCEAAVDENFLYESWGKSQNYIVSFSKSEVIDITEKYTKNFNKTELKRLEAGIDQSFIDVSLNAAHLQIVNSTATTP